jgi:hypothetical protein
VKEPNFQRPAHHNLVLPLLSYTISFSCWLFRL